MSILIKNATIIYPGHELNNTKKDILIKNGVIEKIATSIPAEKNKVISSKNLHVSPGWMDIGATVGEPGYEYRETLESLTHTAASGGYTALAVFPNTQPVVDNRSSVQYILSQTADHIVTHYPVGALSKTCKGEEITEMMDMHHSGAVAFSDGLKAVTSNGLMMRALDYVKSVDGLIIHHPSDPGVTNDNQVNEGVVSIELGMKGNPNISEILSLDRDIQLNTYTDSKMLLHNVSTQESVEKIAAQKSKKLFASVSYMNLCQTEKSLRTYNSNYKVIPPLRTEEDQSSLINGVNKKVIQLITSNHVPLEEEAKKKEYIYAKAGATGLQTCYAAVNTHASAISISRFVTCLAINSRKILNLPQVEFTKGTPAELTLFDPTTEWTLDAKTNTSKSKNSPFWNKSLKGAVIGIINGKKTFFNKY